MTFQPPSRRVYQDGRTYTWNMSLEHQFGAHWLAKAAYVASESDHQAFQNKPTQAYLSAGRSVPRRSSPADPVTVAGTVTRHYRISRRVDTYYSEVRHVISPASSPWKSALAMACSSRPITLTPIPSTSSTGTGINIGYPDDPGCVSCNRGNAYMDIPQVFVANFIYETPSWQDGTRQQNLRWADGSLAASTGRSRAFLLPSIAVALRRGSTQPRTGRSTPQGLPVFTPTREISAYSSNLGGFTGYLNLSDFNTGGPPQGSSGDSGKNPTGSFGPGVNTWDLGMTKNFKFTERYRLQFRWEMFNAFNRVTFGQPNNNVASGANFGLINYTNGAYPSRVMQGALKLNF